MLKVTQTKEFPQSIVPSYNVRLNFSGHETFPFRYTWLKKAVDAVTEDPYIFSKDTAIIDLGVGKNMVFSIEYWARTIGVIENTSKSKESSNKSFMVSDFGKALLLDRGWDPYLEDMATLWLLHWKICTNLCQATTWYFAFNHITHIEFTKEQLLNEVTAFAASNNFKKSLKTIGRDVDCFIKTYIPSKTSQLGVLEDTLDCPLTELSLIREIGQRGLYVFSRSYQRELPEWIFIYSLLDFWNNFDDNRQSLSFEDIAYNQGSPGLIFKIDEDSLALRLSRIEELTEGALRYDETSNLRQVYRVKHEFPEKYLVKHYGE